MLVLDVDAESCANDRWVNQVMPETNIDCQLRPVPPCTSLRRHCIRFHCVSPLFFLCYSICFMLAPIYFLYFTSLQSNVLSVQLLSTLLCTQDEVSDDEDGLCCR
jgi:hypothetical protein